VILLQLTTKCCVMRFYDFYSNIVLNEEKTQNFNKASHIQVMCNNVTLENCKKTSETKSPHYFGWCTKRESDRTTSILW